MSLLIPFNECIARPDEPEKRYLLKDHLIRVKKFAENWIEEEEPVLKKLMGLAAVCHDVAKSHADWQVYINHADIKKGPTHAPAGAFLFSYLGYEWLTLNDHWDKYRVVWMWLVRDIADHHGRLKKLDEDHWIYQADWEKTDLKGIVLFLKELYPKLEHLDVSIDRLDSWLEEVYEFIDEVMDDLDLGYDEPEVLDLMRKLQDWRQFTTALIAGDRFDVTETETSWLDKEALKKGDEAIDLYCLSKSHHSLSRVRLDAQKNILKQLSEWPNKRFYTLEMPTGYGKTITALKMSIWLGKKQDYRKVIYVAPYLSILEQTSHVIEEAMRIGVLEHHSLAVSDKENQNSSKDEQRVPKSQLAMESWAHSIICTSFQQWSKAIFPGRAQEVLRRAFLRDAVVIIDEPQIFDPNVWNLFLTGLEAISEKNNLRVLFLSATMPPFKYGLSREPTYLKIANMSLAERYIIKNEDRMDEQQLARFLKERKEVKQAAILNTIEDAYRVYKELEDDGDARLLHGMMVPLHKKITITKIQNQLDAKKEISLKVISTQIIEAGVDVSFHHVARALPIMPSVVQAAGRVNRHFETAKGMLSVVPFYREGKKNTRNSIYDQTLQRITDRLLLKKETWSESEMIPLVKQYYEEMFRENTYETAKQAIYAAYEGQWAELAKFQPFGQDYLKLPLFVPWEIKPEDQEWLPQQFRELQKKFGVLDVLSLYERYRDRNYLNKFSFEERKQFMILFHHFVLSVPVQVALKFVSQEDYLQSNRIPFLDDDDGYNSDLGLIGHLNEMDNII